VFVAYALLYISNSMCSLLAMSHDMLFGALVGLDHVSLTRAQATGHALFSLGRDQYIWKRLYDAQRGGRSVLAAPTDWITAFRGLRPAWDFPLIDPRTEHCWKVLATDDDVPDGLGGQDPKLFDLGGGKLLLLAGATYAEQRGGHRLQSAPASAYMVDLSTLGTTSYSSAGVSAVATAATGGYPAADVEEEDADERQTEISEGEKAKSTWQPVAVDGDAPPSLHGSYSGAFGDGVVADRLLSFGGGNHVSVHGLVSALDLTGLPARATWRTLEVEAGLEQPGPRYAGASTVWDGALVVLAGRYYGEFYDGSEIWVLREIADRSREGDEPAVTARAHWELMMPSGDSPSHRVWASAVTIGNQVLLYGGALWTFDSSCWGNDRPGTVWVCNMHTHTWSRLDTSDLKPPMRVGAITAICGNHLLVYGGCDLVRRRYLDDVWLFDLAAIRDSDDSNTTQTNAAKASEWTKLEAHGAMSPGARSHGVAIAVPTRRAVLVFGGAQYLNGIYYKDLLQLEPVSGNQMAVTCKLPRRSCEMT